MWTKERKKSNLVDPEKSQKIVINPESEQYVISLFFYGKKKIINEPYLIKEEKILLEAERQILGNIYLQIYDHPSEKIV